MNCRSVQSRLSAYLDGELTGQEMFCIRDHLNRCIVCRDELTSLKGLKRLIGSIACPEPSRDFESRMVASVTAERPKAAVAPFRSAVLFVSVAGFTMVATLQVLGAFSATPVTASRTDASSPRSGIDFELNRDAMTSAISDPISGAGVWSAADSR